MKRIILIALLVLSFVSPAAAVSDAYILLGASNAAHPEIAASFEAATGVDVIVCARGKTGVDYWLSSLPYKRCVNSAKGYNIIGVLFVNGEQEAKAGGDWLALTVKLTNKLNATFAKTLPVYHVRAHKDFPGVHLQTVRAAQWASGWCVVDVDDLTLDSSWHYSPASDTVIGQRLADCK